MHSSMIDTDNNNSRMTMVHDDDDNDGNDGIDGNDGDDDDSNGVFVCACVYFV